MAEFFGFGGYNRTPEGYMSWQHLVFATFFLVTMIVVSIIVGLKFRNKDEVQKNKVMVWTAILIVASEVFHITICCIREKSFSPILHNLPLFLCSIQFITIPLAAFAKGRVKEAALDFVFIFGILSAVMGVYGAGQNFNAYPVLSFDNVISAITHTISGFASLYIVISGMASMKAKNIWITYVILISVCILAYIADILIPYNYMFLMRGDGTPYDIFYNLVNGSRVFYPIIVVALFLLYILVFYLIYFWIKKMADKKHSQQNSN